jgi:hypothetical protein
MRRSKRSRAVDEVIAHFEAEDRAVVYLDKFPPQVALATALSVELALATRCEEEQSEMIRRDDPREVYPITDDKLQSVKAAFAAIPANVRPDNNAEQYIINLLADFPLDRAWRVAHKIASWAAFYARIEQMHLAS